MVSSPVCLTHIVSPRAFILTFPVDVRVQWFTSPSTSAMPGVYSSLPSTVWFDTESPWSCQQAHILHATSNTHTESDTHTHTQIQPTWVVKLAACISGIDLCSIEPCHCCHLNFGLCTFPKSPPCHHTPPPPPPPPIASSAPSSSEWKMDGTPTTDCSSPAWSGLPLPNQRGANFLWLAGGKKKCLGGEKGSFISLLQTLAAHFIKLSPVKYIPPSQAKAHGGQEASEASYWNCHLIRRNIAETSLHK